jgi:RND family efflux transporter MFP subunit
MTDSKPTHSGRRKLLIAAAAVIVLALLVLYQTGAFVPNKVPPGRTPRDGETEPADRYREITVRAEEVPRIYKSVGSIQSQDQVEVSSRIVARVTAVEVRNGDRVEEGDLLVKLDDTDLQAAVRRARSQVESAKAAIDSARERVNAAQARLDLATVNLKRMRDLYKERAIEEMRLDEAESEFRQAQAAFSEAQQREKATVSELAAAQQSLRGAEATLAYASIRAPMDGIVAQRLVDPGDLASPGTILARLFDPRLLRFEVPVRESLVKAVTIGDTVPLDVPALEKSYAGEIREIVPDVDPRSRTFMVMVCLGEYPELVPGMYATLRLKLGTEQALLIPEAAVSRVGQLEYAAIRTESGPRRVLIRTRPAQGGLREVVSGLEEGMRVLVPKG